MRKTLHDLEAIQRWMQAVIVHPGGVTAGLAAAESRQHIDVSAHNLEQVVTRSSALTPLRRLGIYSHAYSARLQECLSAEFPVLLHALGEKLFNLFTFDYLQHYPSRSYTLARLGENFPRYLAETRPDATAPDGARESWPDFIIDLATFERAFGEIFDGPGVEDQQILATDDILVTEHLREVRLAPVVCLKLLIFRYPVSQYFTAVRNHDDPALPTTANTFLAMTRRSYTVMVHEIDGRQYDLLTSLIAGQSLNQAISALPKGSADAHQTLIATMSDWIRDWIVKGFFYRAERLAT